MNEEDYKLHLRQCALRAARHHARYRIAQEIECSRQTFSNFMSGGPLGAEYRARLEAWLREHNYWVEVDNDTPAANASTAQRILANEFRSMAEIMESDISDEFKADRFMAFINTYSKAYEQEMKRKRGE
jgi:hypothetical protein